MVWQICIIEYYSKMLPNRFYFCYDNDVIFMNTNHISRYIVYRFIFCPWTVLLECMKQQKKLVREYHMFYIISNIAATLIMYYVCIKQLLQIRCKYSIWYERIFGLRPTSFMCLENLNMQSLFDIIFSQYIILPCLYRKVYVKDDSMIIGKITTRPDIGIKHRNSLSLMNHNNER